MAIAEEHWRGSKTKPWDPALVTKLYKEELLPSNFALNKVMILEYSQYLEKYLWPNYDPLKATDAHVLSLVCMVNEKFREQVKPTIAALVAF